ncbi:MAG TPA: MlaE family lipid ABC transporter permease subunit [Candidatus Eisenbacteria bacterium]|nr:MlaE family lipid ABC transporter permease subunit [Candidatus Eisenbacteria bacterium]
MARVSSPAVELRDLGERAGARHIALSGRLDAATTGTIWRRALALAEQAENPELVLDLSAIEYCDGSGIALLLELERRRRASGGTLEIRGLRPEFQELLDTWAPEDTGRLVAQPAPRPTNVAEEVGRAFVQVLRDLSSLVGFVGELSVALTKAAFRPGLIRWKDALRVAETAGVNALPIVALISFLMGLIMAFQAALPLAQFGAQLFVANLVGLAMMRELGPLMTAILLAGRSGSAFAAELGTMKVREEIDALKTMGLDPVRFLVVPRVIAALFMTPLLTVFSNLLGLAGGAVVFISLGFPLITFFKQVQWQVTYGDLLGGLLKSFVFGILVAAIGCLRGLETKIGASAVGESTTRAVVSGIILIVVTDGIFSVVYYYLGI